MSTDGTGHLAGGDSGGCGNCKSALLVLVVLLAHRDKTTRPNQACSLPAGCGNVEKKPAPRELTPRQLWPRREAALVEQLSAILDAGPPQWSQTPLHVLGRRPPIGTTCITITAVIIKLLQYITQTLAANTAASWRSSCSTTPSFVSSSSPRPSPFSSLTTLLASRPDLVLRLPPIPSTLGPFA
ncbi:hypothetical protein JDV02_009835 [Purpureocillium takamizusanense]|uniref:Uncharacterized protein n=1 Tax=Purpureocillium takamizusanense TaxID=2060973 RepID=A0A9Q8QRP0_9HYPO|nr:uncharacterized protein JDV02_009835 [Purpureocillium takamizusanense]UNI24056.1 hypothetical protein JDV02_009835 [Purpureocillium takamizusanense]